MAAEYTPILEGSNFGNKTAKKFVLPPKFQKVRFEMHKSSQIFRSFMQAKPSMQRVCLARVCA